MDDDDSVRSAFSMILTNIGHTVEYAENGSEAIETIVRAKANGTSFDCAILDLTVVSGIGAEQTIKQILEIDPRIKTILTTGYVDHPVVDDYKNHGFHSILKKPFNLTDVQEAISSVFTGPVAG